MSEALVPEVEDPEVQIFEGYTEPPEPYDENMVPKETRNWVDDYGDHVIPSGKGFITDFVYHTRGYMIPTLACVWSALFLLSTAIKREAWVEWNPRPLFPNLFIVIVGPAGRAKKTTAVTQIGLPILRRFRSYIRDGNIYRMKYINVVKDMNSPEYVIDAMLPDRKPEEDFYLVDKNGDNLLDAEGKAIRYRRTSETAIIASELSTFLSSRSYSESMSSLMLDLYDCHSDWDWGTLGRGRKTLRRMYTTFIAGSTVDGIRQSVPKAAKGDGFLSRTILVYVPTSKRQYPRPMRAIGSPSEEELSKRLAWIVERSIGEFRMTERANQEYERWYRWFYQKMEDNPALEGAISRMDIHLLKVSMLIHASRYGAQPNLIDLQDIRDAIRLIDATYASLGLLLSQIGEDDVLRDVSRVEMMLRKRGREGMVRNYILKNARMKTDVLDMVLSELAARGVVEFELNGVRFGTSTGNSWETVYWTGEDDDESNRFSGIFGGSPGEGDSYVSGGERSRSGETAKRLPHDAPILPEKAPKRKPRSNGTRRHRK